MEAKSGDKVKLHYTLKDAEGEVVDTTKDLSPIEFTIGEGKVIPGIENAVIGMKINETKSITVTPKDGYGEREDKKVFKYQRKSAPENFTPRVGDSVQLHRPNGAPLPVRVLGFDNTSFTMDANHPLAGKELYFDLELILIFS